MPQPSISDLIAQLTEALRIDDDVALFAASDALARLIGREAVLALIRALLYEVRPSITSLQLMAPPTVRFA